MRTTEQEQQLVRNVGANRVWRLGLHLVLLGFAVGALACRFNVRDVGFVDLGSHDYELVCWVDSTVPASQRSQMRNTGLAALMDCNIKVVVREFDGKGAAPADEFPAAVLYDPLGRSFPNPTFQGVPDDALWDVLEGIVTSPARDRIVDGILNSYGAVIFIPGTDPDENERVQGAVDSAIAAVSRGVVQKTLEKDIENPPRLFEIPRTDLFSERYFLWSLGIRPEETRPQVAMLYGRGRQIGRTMVGKEISYGSVFQVLNTIGLSCECGLDRSWMQGAMIPVRWDSSTQTQVTKDLGFDPESPEIKIEMSQILAKSAKAQRLRQERSSVAASESSSEAATGRDNRQRGSDSPVVETTIDRNASERSIVESANEDVPSQRNSAKAESPAWGLWIGVPVAFLLIGGLLLLIRSASRKS